MKAYLSIGRRYGVMDGAGYLEWSRDINGTSYQFRVLPHMPARRRWRGLPATVIVAVYDECAGEWINVHRWDGPAPAPWQAPPWERSGEVASCGG